MVIGRKGSRGLPGKAELELAGKPTAQWVLEWAKSLDGRGIRNHVVFSTDIDSFEPLCRDLDVEFIRRPDSLAGDRIRVEDVLYHAASHKGDTWDYLLLLYANVPIRYDHLILDPIAFLEEHRTFQGLLTFQQVGKFNPAWMVQLDTERLPAWKAAPFRRQELKPLMIHDGHTLLTRWSWFMDFWPHRNEKATGQMYESFGSPLKPWVHDELIIDIDEPKDFLIAHALMLLGEQGRQDVLDRITRRS